MKDNEALDKLVKYLNGIGCWVEKKEFENYYLSRNIIRILPYQYKDIVSKVLAYGKFDAIKFTPDEEKFLREHGLVEFLDDNKKV